jgi:exopolysaccharide biosynthesis polyprenyl glycosylphosphotransferase
MLRYPKYKYQYATIDFIILLFSFLNAGYITEHFSSNKVSNFSYFAPYETICYTIASFLFIFLFQYFNLYKMNVFLTRANHLVQILKALLTGVILLIIFNFLLKIDIIPDYSRLYVVIFFIVSLLSLIILRIFFLQILNSILLNKTVLNRKIAIIGAGISGKILAEKVMFEDLVGMNVVGFIDDNIPEGEAVFSKLKVLGKIKDIRSIVDEYKIHELIVSIDKIDYENLLKIVDECLKLDIKVKISSPLFKIIPNKIFIEEYSNIPVIDVSNKIQPNISMFIKRVIDYVVTITLLVAIIPFGLVIALIIKLTSKGPVIFSQMRIGKDGKPFKFYKFRTMTILDEEDSYRQKMMINFIKNDDTHLNNSTKIINEKRITIIGKLLRKLSLDELPQLFNVLKGDMSLVGPRPCLPYEYELYDEWQKRRHQVLPGCTGVWQVSGRSNVSFKDSIILDIYYVNNITPWLDLQLIFKTIPVMLFAKGGK